MDCRDKLTTLPVQYLDVATFIEEQTVQAWFTLPCRTLRGMAHSLELRLPHLLDYVTQKLECDRPRQQCCPDKCAL